MGTNTWQVRATDLAYGWVAPPKNFVGSTDLVAELRLADNKIADRQVLHLEWCTDLARRSAHRRCDLRGGEDCRGSTDREISPGEETTIGRRGGGREAGVRGDGKGASTGKFGRTSPALVERPSRAWATPQGVRHKAEGHYVLLRPLAALAQDEEPERAGGKTGGPDVKSSAIRHRSNHSTCSASATQ